MPSLVEESRQIWDAKADWWDQTITDEYPVCGERVERLLRTGPGMHVLEVACGNGIFSPRLAQSGAEVLACDFSAAFLRAARARTPAELAGRIDYRLLDATDEAQLRTLGEPASFDAALCSMALMDMPEIAPLMAALAGLLKPGAPFVFSVAHPCFSQLGASRLLERELHDGAVVTRYTVKVERYLSLKSGKGLGIEGEPLPHLYFDRSLTDLLRPGLASGFTIDAFEEAPAVLHKTASPLAWGHFPEIPAFLLVRMRRS